jgi:UPF0755 protein
MIRSFFIAVAAMFMLSILAITGGYVYTQHYITTPLTRSEPKELIIPKGTGGGQIAEILEREGIISNAFMFKIAIKTTRPPITLIAGEYLFPARISPKEVLELLASGKVIQRSVTIPEGLTVTEALKILATAPYLQGDMPDASTLQEGSLLPETYSYQRGDTRTSILLRMQQELNKHLQIAWDSRSEGLPLNTPQEMLILASIVEKETGIATERPHIASVFINRLKLGMKLQSDPTTIYGKYVETGTKQHTLSKSDLNRNDDYNTYIIDALPPTPIALVGKAALEAVAHPLASKDLYFVATGSGGHNFAATLEEHNKNVANYRKQLQQKP